MNDIATAAYACHSRFTDPGWHAALLGDLPADVASICATLQGLFIHLFEIHLYGVHIPAGDQVNGDIEHVESLLQKVLELNASPLSIVRPLDQRVGIICRQYSMLACSILRQHGVPARTRGGFANYLAEGRWIGHSTCQWWNGQRWVRFDPQIDAVQKQAHNIEFDILDMPTTCYLSGAEAWRAYRSGSLAPDLVEGGVPNLRNGVVLDLWEMCKLETHRFRSPIMNDPTSPPSATEAKRIDEIVDATLLAQDSFTSLWSLYESLPDLHIPVAK